MLSMDAIRRAVRQAAAEYPVKRVELFGSYANGTAGSKSDIDLLVEFTQSPISVLEICGFQESLIALLRTPVDVVELPLQEDSDLEIVKRVCLYES